MHYIWSTEKMWPWLTLGHGQRPLRLTSINGQTHPIQLWGWKDFDYRKTFSSISQLVVILFVVLEWLLHGDQKKQTKSCFSGICSCVTIGAKEGTWIYSILQELKFIWFFKGLLFNLIINHACNWCQRRNMDLFYPSRA